MKILEMGSGLTGNFRYAQLLYEIAGDIKFLGENKIQLMNRK